MDNRKRDRLALGPEYEERNREDETESEGDNSDLSEEDGDGGEDIAGNRDGGNAADRDGGIVGNAGNRNGGNAGNAAIPNGGIAGNAANRNAGNVAIRNGGNAANRNGGNAGDRNDGNVDLSDSDTDSDDQQIAVEEGAARLLRAVERALMRHAHRIMAPPPARANLFSLPSTVMHRIILELGVQGTALLRSVCHRLHDTYDRDRILWRSLFIKEFQFDKRVVWKRENRRRRHLRWKLDLPNDLKSGDVNTWKESFKLMYEAIYLITAAVDPAAYRRPSVVADNAADGTNLNDKVVFIRNGQYTLDKDFFARHYPRDEVRQGCNGHQWTKLIWLGEYNANVRFVPETEFLGASEFLFLRHVSITSVKLGKIAWRMHNMFAWQLQMTFVDCTFEESFAMENYNHSMLFIGCAMPDTMEVVQNKSMCHLEMHSCKFNKASHSLTVNGKEPPSQPALMKQCTMRTPRLAISLPGSPCLIATKCDLFNGSVQLNFVRDSEGLGFDSVAFRGNRFNNSDLKLELEPLAIDADTMEASKELWMQTFHQANQLIGANN